MALPANWNLVRPPSGSRSLRFFREGTGTANYSDNAFIFIDQATANPYSPLPYTAPGSGLVTSLPLVPTGTGRDPHDNQPVESPIPLIWSGSIRVRNVGGVGIPIDLYFSFDGVNDHGRIPFGASVIYRDRFEARIALRGLVGFAVEAW